MEKTKSSNREEEGQYEKNEMNHIEPGSEWERVAKHCDFSAKVDTNNSSVKWASIVYLLDIKIEEPYCHYVAGSGAHQGRVEDAGDHAAAQAEPDCESLNFTIIVFYLFLHSYFNTWNGCLYTL